MTGLGRVNLLVGTNNSGKTSVLEAINILLAQGRLEAVWDTLSRRGERQVLEVEGLPRRLIEMDVRHLFYGHELDQKMILEIGGQNDTTKTTFTVKTVENNDPKLIELPESAIFLSELALEFQWKGNTDSQITLPLSPMGGINNSDWIRYARKQDENIIPMRFITTNALDGSRIIADFDKIVLTPEESTIIQALKTIEPNLERIASVSSDQRNSLAGRGGMVVKLSNSDQRIPIGSMGDGIWRMLGIALSLVNARGGILLIDEIDTGLHYKAMEDMWRLVMETATRLSVQVFATTHSRDCYEALAAISRPDISVGSDISIQRIERGKEKAISFTEQQIVMAAESALEIR
jgi:ABC-type branched-subunit amino acid transport system ATPase component